MKADFRMILLLGVGIVALGWGVTYYQPIAQLVGTGTNGYLTMVHGLEPPQIAGSYGSGTIGAGQFQSGTAMSGGAMIPSGPYAIG
jgi:hypothetical protein